MGDLRSEPAGPLSPGPRRTTVRLDALPPSRRGKSFGQLCCEHTLPFVL